MKHTPLKSTLPPADFSMSKEEMESRILSLEMMVEELCRARHEHLKLMKKLADAIYKDDE